jgi:hypothetical protein
VLSVRSGFPLCFWIRSGCLRVSKRLSFVFKCLSKFSTIFLGKIATGRLGGLGRSLNVCQNSRIGDPVECPSFERSCCNRKVLDTAGKDEYLFETTSSARIEVWKYRSL